MCLFSFKKVRIYRFLANIMVFYGLIYLLDYWPYSILRHFCIDLYEVLSDNPIELKLPDSLIHRVGSYMNISIHCCLDTGMT